MAKAKVTAEKKVDTSKPEKKSALVKPRITEKTAIMSESKNVYTFDVEREATKSTIIASIKAAYKVTPLSVRMLAIPKVKVFVRGKWGIKGGGKKAYVYLKKGDKIDFA